MCIYVVCIITLSRHVDPAREPTLRFRRQCGLDLPGVACVS